MSLNMSVFGTHYAPGELPVDPLASKALLIPVAMSSLNTLATVINGTGAPGIYNSSYTPDSQYGTYNWCNVSLTYSDLKSLC